MDLVRPSRRELLIAAGAAVCSRSRAASPPQRVRPIRFGVIADVHHGLAERTEQRLTDFLEEASRRELDFIVQLGDFNHPLPEAEGFLRLWHSYRGSKFSVLGNHDMDRGSKAQALERWESSGRFYSFDRGWLHFVVLDANFMQADGRMIPYETGNWYRSGITASWIDPEQIEWLRGDLASTRKPTVIFVHQMIDEVWGGGAVPNRQEVRAAIEESGKVMAVIQGHAHQDVHEVRNGVLYWRLNSSSYAWVGDAYGRMAHYDRSLYSFVTIDEPVEASGGGAQLRIRAEDRRGIFEGDSPFARGVPNPDRFSSSIHGIEESMSLGERYCRELGPDSVEEARRSLLSIGRLLRNGRPNLEPIVEP